MDEMESSECDNYLGALQSAVPTKPVPTLDAKLHDEAHEWLTANGKLKSADTFREVKLGAYFLDKYAQQVEEKTSEEDVFSQYLKSEEFKTFLNYFAYCRRNPTYDDFDVLLILGQGALGTVEAVKRVSTGEVYALKRQCKRMIKQKKCKKYIIQEKEILASIHSKFVVELVHSFDSDDYVFMVMECMAGGTLEFNIQGHNGFNENTTKFYAAEVALGLQALRDENVFYRDLKSENILLDLQGHAHICDLGIAVKLEEGQKVKRKIGTTGWWAPEVIRGDKSDFVADWFSYGVLLYQMVSNQQPFIEQAKVSGKHPDELILNWDPDFEKLECSNDMKDLIEQLLKKNASERLHGLDQIKSHPVFKDFQWDAIEAQEVPAPIEPSQEDANTDHDDLKSQFTTPDLDLDEEDRNFPNWNMTRPQAIEDEIIKIIENGTIKKPEVREEPKVAATQCFCVIN